jgi:hypothetical protein
MIIEQFKAKSFNVEFKDFEGHEIVIKPDSLDGNYMITFHIQTTNPERNMANYSMAASARGTISDYTIRRKVLELEDPAREENRIADELAEKSSPALFFYRQCLRMIAEYETLSGDDQKNKFYEFKILLAKLDRALDEEAALGQQGGAAPQPSRMNLPLPGGMPATPALPAPARQPTPEAIPEATSEGQEPQMAAFSPETRVQRQDLALRAKAGLRPGLGG